MKVVVIGNGIAGFSAASTVRRLSKDCSITMISRETTSLYSACVLPDYISNKIPREKTFVKSKTDYKQLGLEMIFGNVVQEIDTAAKRVLTDNGQAYAFDKLILALGSDAIVFGEPKAGVFKLKTLRDAERILKHNGNKAVVVGSGAIGIEVAIALHYRGYQVKIIEMADQILPLGLGVKGASKIQKILQGFGIEVSTGERAAEVEGQHHVEALVTDQRRIACDTLIWAIGMRPQVELARRANIAIGEKGGIRVNTHMETSIPGIYACGDCVESNDILTGEPYLNLFWHNANRQGAVAAYNCIWANKSYPGSQNILNIDVFGNHVVGFGFTEEAVYRFQDIPALAGKLGDLETIEREDGRSYYSLVLLRDRCLGGQFVNAANVRDIGLIWSIIFRGKSIKKLLEMFGDENVMCRRPWLHRVRPFFRPNQTN